MLRLMNYFLIGIIDLSVSSLDTHFSRIFLVVFGQKLTIFFERRQIFLSGLGKYLNRELEVRRDIKVASKLCS